MKIAISACLLGVNCRFDGGHKKDKFITDELSKYAEFVSFCPEDATLGSPRESMRLVHFEDGIKMIGNKSKQDYTTTIKEYSIKRLNELKKSDICGIILKSKSPSCGQKVKVYLPNSMPDDIQSDGVFASLTKEVFPNFPIEDEGRLQDSWLRENFVMQLFAYSDFEKLKASIKKYGELVEFHSSYKYLLLSKSTKDYELLGRVVANHQKLDLKEVLLSYEIVFKEAIAKKSSIKKSMNVLEHIYGFLKNNLDKSEKDELFKIFDEFRDRVIPLIVPISIINIYTKKYSVEFLLKQKFLNPYPADLALRSNINALK